MRYRNSISVPNMPISGTVVNSEPVERRHNPMSITRAAVALGAVASLILSSSAVPRSHAESGAHHPGQGRLVALSRDAAAPIKHIVFLVKENHTFDNYFGTFPGADGATTGRL